MMIGATLRRIFANAGITARRQAELTQELTRQEAERVSAAKSELLSRMSHELRTPLHAILGFGQLLEGERQILTKQQIQYVEHILSAGRHLLGLVDEVLKIPHFARLEDVSRWQRVDFHAVVQGALDAVQPLAKQHGITLSWVCNSPKVTIQTDQTQIRTVLVQLLENAIKYNRPSGRVELRCLAITGGVRIEIEDSGIGIAPAEVEKIFEPFYRGEGSAGIEGKGLGLYHCKVVLEAMKSRVRVRSVKGLGSTFWFELFDQLLR